MDKVKCLVKKMLWMSILWLCCVCFVSPAAAEEKPAKAANLEQANLIKLGGFEETYPKAYKAEGWSIKFNRGATISDEAAHSGKYSLKMQVLYPEEAPVFNIAFSCPVKPGEQYNITLWAKAEKAGGGKYVLYPDVYISGENEKGKFEKKWVQLGTIKESTFDWKKIEYTSEMIPKGVSSLMLRISTRATEGNLYIDDVKVIPFLSQTYYRTGSATTYYVAPSGSDDNAGLVDKPLRTIQKAADLARAGDTVMVRVGIYADQEVAIKNSGSAGRPVTFQGERGPNGEWLTVLDVSKQVEKWVAAPEVGPGVFKTTGTGFKFL